MIGGTTPGRPAARLAPEAAPRSGRRRRPDGGRLMARLRLFAILREAAGTGSVEVPGTTVEEVVANATARFGPAFARALLTAQTWVNGERAGPATPVNDEDEVALIPRSPEAPPWCAPPWEWNWPCSPG